MLYKLVILDNNEWMYLDMAYQFIPMFERMGHCAEIVQYENGKNTSEIRYMFLGTNYRYYTIPTNSIVSNFDSIAHMFEILTEDIIRRCEIWDYSEKNIRLIKEMYPESICHFVELGYSELLDFGIKNKEDDKDIDVLMLGVETPRRMNILDNLRRRGLNVLVVYRKTGKERADLIGRTKVVISIYGHEDDTEYISSSRFAPVLSNGGFIIAENCSDYVQNTKWSEFMISVGYDEIVGTVHKYIIAPCKRILLREEFYNRFKCNRPKSCL
jgi:hypothetical protein